MFWLAEWAFALAVFQQPSTTGLAAGQKPMAAMEVTEMTTVRLDGHIYRAITGADEIYPFLVVEKIRPGETEGDEWLLVGRWSLRDMIGGKSLSRLSEGDDITGLRWRRGILEFAYVTPKGSSKCRVSNVTSSTPAVSCELLKR